MGLLTHVRMRGLPTIAGVFLFQTPGPSSFLVPNFSTSLLLEVGGGQGGGGATPNSITWRSYTLGATGGGGSDETYAIFSIYVLQAWQGYGGIGSQWSYTSFMGQYEQVINGTNGANGTASGGNLFNITGGNNFGTSGWGVGQQATYLDTNKGLQIMHAGNGGEGGYSSSSFNTSQCPPGTVISYYIDAGGPAAIPGQINNYSSPVAGAPGYVRFTLS